MRFDLRHLRAFCALSEELHFNRAAERLHIAQPALSRTIQALEESVGVVLLKRSTRSVELTAAGRAFLVQCRLGLGHLEHAVTVARRTADGETGELRIAYMDFAINGRVPELLRAFRETHPGIRLNLSFLATSHQKVALMEHKIDLGFLIGTLDNPRICNYPFDQEGYVALLPATHRLANVKDLRLADLAKEPFVLGNGENWSAYRDRLFVLCHQAGFFPEIVQEASSSEGIFGLVAAGTGVTVYASCARNIQRRGLVIRPLEDVRETIPVFAAWNATEASPGLVRFTEFLKQSSIGLSTPG
ncbi:LysR family transcriptional regulator [Rhodospirillaceae bacterium SYSU D60014]|uniref:LysR family transcriptional regulator n=1 Tax=Virgifigura deserti TaxID=2268457 RepID=UPI000E66D854